MTATPPDRIREQLQRNLSPDRISADPGDTDPPPRRLRRCRGGLFTKRSGTALEKWPAEGMPANPHAWLVSAGRFRAIDALRRNSRFESFDESRVASGRWGPRGGRRREHRGRPPPPGLHLLSSGAQLRRAGGTDPARGGVWTRRGRDRPGVPGPRRHPRTTHRAGKGEDPGGRRSVSGARTPGSPSAPGRRPACRLSRLQRKATPPRRDLRSPVTISRKKPFASGRLLVDLLTEPEVFGLLGLMLLQESRRAARAPRPTERSCFSNSRTGLSGAVT